MELRHLRYFVTIAEAGSFTEAAKRLFTVQPSLSRQIKDLEAYLGVRLFTRSGRKVILTAAGQVFLDEARLVLAQSERAVDKVRQFTRQDRRQLVVGFDYGLEQQYLGLVSKLIQTAIEGDLIIRSHSAPTLSQMVQQGKVDVAFIPFISEMHDGLMLKAAFKLRVYAHEAHTLRQIGNLTVNDLQAYKFAVPSRNLAPALYSHAMQFARNNQLEIDVAFEIESLSMASALGKQTGHLLLLPDYSSALLPDDVRELHTDAELPDVPCGLIFHNDPVSREFATELQEQQLSGKTP